MNNQELLQELSAKINAGELNREELIGWLNNKPAASTKKEDERFIKKVSITKILYIVGAAVVLIGVVIFVGQIWTDIGSLGRITVTLGLGLLIAAMGSVLLQLNTEKSIGTIFHFIGGMLIPGGTITILQEYNMTGNWSVTIAFTAICAFYLLLTVIHRYAVLTFFLIANGTATTYLLLNAITSGLLRGNTDDLYAYLTMAIGTSYLLLAHAFRDSWNKKLIGALYLFGITGFLGATFSQVFNSLPWQMIYFLLVIGGLMLSVYMKSRSILAMSTIFLIAHVSYITAEYFANSIGWPISLVILGFVFIGLGFTSVTINNKFIAKKI